MIEPTYLDNSQSRTPRNLHSNNETETILRSNNESARSFELKNDDFDEFQMAQSMVLDSGYETTKVKGTRLNPNFMKKLHHFQINREKQNLAVDESAESEIILQRGQPKKVLQ